MKLATLARHDGEGRVWTTTHFETLTIRERLDLIADWLLDLQGLQVETLHEALSGRASITVVGTEAEPSA